MRHKRHNSHRWDLGAYKFLLAPFFMQRYPCFPFSRKSDSSQKVMKDVANKIRMKSINWTNGIFFGKIHWKCGIKTWDIPCLTCSWCTQHWRQNINMHNFSGGSLAGGGKNARVSSNRWYLHACNSLRLRFLLQQHLSFPAFTSAMIAEQLLKSEQWKTIHYLNDQSNSPTCYISNAISNFTIIGQLHDGWNYRKLPKTMIFSKVRTMWRYWIYTMVETAPWEQKPHVIALESLQKVVLETLT